jgi:hypothetical protein
LLQQKVSLFDISTYDQKPKRWQHGPHQIKATLLRILIEFSLLDPKIHFSYCPHFLVRKNLKNILTLKKVLLEDFWNVIQSDRIICHGCNTCIKCHIGT